MAGRVRELPCPALGSTVRVPELPERVVSLAPSLTDAVVSLGAGSSLVGRSAWCRRPREVANLPVVGSYTGCRRDRLEELEPDLVLMTGGVQKSLAVELSRDGIPVYQVPLPVSPWGIVEDVVVVATLCGRPDAGSRLAERCHHELTALRGVLPALRTWVEIDLGGPVTTGLGSYITWSLKWLGLAPMGWGRSDAYSEVGMDWEYGDPPQLVLYDPQPETSVDEETVWARLSARGLDAWRREGTRAVVTEGDLLAHSGPWLLLHGLRALVEGIGSTRP